MLTYSYTFKNPLTPHNSITADSGKPTRKEAFADLRAYVDANYGPDAAPQALCDLRPERVL